MTQVRLTLNEKGEGALSRAADGTIVMDDGIETMFTICWFTDAPANDDDGIDKIEERRGYWADKLDEEDDRPIGSRFWLIERKVLTDDTMREWEAEGKRCSWPMLESGLVSEVAVTVTRLNGFENGIRATAQVLSPTGKTLYQKEWERFFALS